METESSASVWAGSSRCDKTRRACSELEEHTLIASLKEVITLGWKSNNVFRVGYLNKLEESMRRAFPGTDLRGHPHINSKLTTWKKNYSSLVTMLARTGVGFNNTTKLIECTDEAWDIIVQKDGNAKTMRYKKWKLFDEWKEIFEKNRVTGENAEDVMDAVNEMMAGENTPQFMGDDAYHVNLNDIHLDEQEGSSFDQNDKGSQGGRSSGKKRKNPEGVDAIYEMLSQLCRSTDERLENISQRIEYEFDLGNAKKQVYEMISKIPGLSMDQLFDVCEMLADKTERLEIFLGLPEDARPHYVFRLLTRGGT